MSRCTAIRDSNRWKGKICSLTWVTHRDTQILSKCHQMQPQSLMAESKQEFILVVSFGLIFTRQRKVTPLKKGNWKAGVKSHSPIKCGPISSLTVSQKCSLEWAEARIHSLGAEFCDPFALRGELGDWKRSAVSSLLLRARGPGYRRAHQ